MRGNVPSLNVVMAAAKFIFLGNQLSSPGTSAGACCSPEHRGISLLPSRLRQARGLPLACLRHGPGHPPACLSRTQLVLRARLPLPGLLLHPLSQWILPSQPAWDHTRGRLTPGRSPRRASVPAAAAVASCTMAGRLTLGWRYPLVRCHSFGCKMNRLRENEVAKLQGWVRCGPGTVPESGLCCRRRAVGLSLILLPGACAS